LLGLFTFTRKTARVPTRRDALMHTCVLMRLIRAVYYAHPRMNASRARCHGAAQTKQHFGG